VDFVDESPEFIAGHRWDSVGFADKHFRFCGNFNSCFGRDGTRGRDARATHEFGGAFTFGGIRSDGGRDAPTTCGDGAAYWIGRSRGNAVSLEKFARCRSGRF
jgi:hypothetical protein